MIKFAELIAFLIYGLGFVFIVTQIVIPGVSGKPFFPILRHKRSAALHELAEAQEEREIIELKKEIDAIRGEGDGTQNTDSKPVQPAPTARAKRG